MPIDPSHSSPDAVLPTLPRRLSPEAEHSPSGMARAQKHHDPALCHESRQHPLRRLGARNTPPCPAPADPGGPQPPSALMLDEIEARLADAPRDDISGLRSVLWAYQRLLDLLVRTAAPEPAMRRQWLRLRALERRLRSAVRRPPAR